MPYVGSPPSNEEVVFTIADDSDNWTDSDTVSSYGDTTYSIDVTGPDEAAEIFWQYQNAKSRWRKYMHKPTRRVRRSEKKHSRFFSSNGKGKRKSKGAERYAFLAEMPDEAVNAIFYGDAVSGKEPATFIVSRPQQC